MSTLSSIINPVRAASTAPDFANFSNAQEPPVSFPESMPQSQSAQLDSLALDSAVHANRRHTDPEAAEKRSAPRYSLRELNSLTPEQLSARMSMVNPSDDRPGWVKALDLIDLPRNFIANTITGTFMPEAKRMAMQRGEFDQAGLPKVYGSDILKSMGFENKVINGIAGFAIDIFTDPLSWIGGPIGAAKTAGTRGSVTITTTGKRTLNSALNSVRNGRAVSDRTTRHLLDATLAEGVARGAVDAAADGAEKAAYLQKALFGQQGKLSKATDKVGLGRFSRGGTISDDIFRSANNAKGPQEAARIKSTKDWVAKHTINPGIDLTKGKGGATVAHVPFTTKSLTVPSFEIPGFKSRFGGAQELQMAFAKAGEGRVRDAALIASASRHASDINQIRNELTEAFDHIDELRRAEAGPDEMKAAQEALGEVRERFEELKQQTVAMRSRAASEVRNALAGIDDIPTLVATVDALDDAAIEARRAEALTGYRANPDVYTSKDIANARDARSRVAEEAVGMGLVDNADDFFDALADPSRRDDALDDMIRRRAAIMSDRWKSLFLGSEGDLARATAIADTYSEGFLAAQIVANRRMTQVRAAMNADERLVADAMRHLLRVDDRNIGFLPGASFDGIVRSLGAEALSTKIARAGYGLTQHLGGASGESKGMFRMLRDMFNTAGKRASETVSGYAREMEALARQYDIPVEHFDTVAELTGLLAEQLLLKNLLFDNPTMASMMGNAGEAGAKLLREATENGLLRDPGFRRGLEDIAKRIGDDIAKMGQEMLERGEVDNLISAYFPLIMRSDARRSAQIRRGGGDLSRADRIRSGTTGGDIVDPTKARVTNMIHVVGEDGNEVSFTIAEALAYHAKIRSLGAIEEMAASYPNEYENFQRVYAGLEEFLQQRSMPSLAEISQERLEQVLRDNSVPMLPSQVNAYADQGTLDPLTGRVLSSGDDRRAYFETNILNALYSRSKAHEIARVKESFRDAIEPFVAFTVDAGESVSGTAGANVTLQTGEVAEVLGDGRIRLGNTTYVPITQIDLPPDTMFNPSSILGKDSAGAFIPDTIAAQLSRLADTMTPQQMPQVMRVAEGVTSMFRTSTLLHPSWVATNVVGNAFLAAMSGMFNNPKNIPQYLRSMKVATQALIYRNSEHISTMSRAGAATRTVGAKMGMSPDTSVIINGQQVRVGDMVDEAAEFAAIGDGNAVEAQQQMMKLMNDTIPGLSDGQGGGFKAKVTRGRDRRRSGRESTSRLQNAADSVAAGREALPLGGVRRMISAWFAGGAMVDDSFRLAQFMMYRTQGFDAATAAAKVKHDMLNFGDMTSFEQNYMRPLIPFYAWLRASFPAYAVRSIKDPKQLSLIPKVQQGIEETINGDDRLPRHMRPRWLQETMAIQIGTDPETRKALLGGTLIPQEGVITALQPLASGFDGSDMFDLINWSMSQFSPVARVPFELATGREIFSGRDIGFSPGEGDISLYDYLTSQVRPVKELGLGLRDGQIQKAFDVSTGAGISRALIGGRLQTGLADPKRQNTLYFEMSKKIDDLRRAVRRAENDGDDERAAKMKFEILATYKRYAERGVPLESMPKWARQDLQAFAQ